MPRTCLKLLLQLFLLLFLVGVFCQDCQKDGLCAKAEKIEQQHHLYDSDQQHSDASIKTDISSTTDILSDVESNDTTHASKNKDSSTKSVDDLPKCHDFDPTTFGKDNSSIFIIEARGRIGNHLMAYTLIKGFQAKLNIQVLLIFNVVFQNNLDKASKK